MGHQNYHEKNFFLLTAVIVVMLGLPTLTSILSEPINKSEVTLVSDYSNRGPASALPSSEGEAANSVTMNMSCGSLPSSYDVVGAHLRIKSTGCKDLDISKLSIVNKSNGFTASIFPTKDNQFTTDYMDLTEGENAIEVTLRELSGIEKTHSIKIQKRAPASSQ